MKMKDMFSPSNSRPSTPPRSPCPSPPRTFSESIMEENIGNAELIIRRWDVDAVDGSGVYKSMTPQLFSTSEENEQRENQQQQQQQQQFINAVKDVREAMHFFAKEKYSTSSEILVRGQNLMEIAMKRLEREFYTILKTKRSVLMDAGKSTVSSAANDSSSGIFSDVENGESTSADDEVNDNEEINVIENPTTTTTTSEDVISPLRTIAECMISSGYGKECVYIYKLIRKSIVDETLYYLGIEKLTASQIQKMDWDFLDLKVKNWLNAVKNDAVKTLFRGERFLCDVVFSSSEKIRESCFAEIIRDDALMFFGFPENVAKCKRKILSPEKIFRFLDIYEAISDIWMEIESIFSFDSLSAVKTQAIASLLKLGEAVRVMLSQFEEAIQKDSLKTSVPGGGVHPLTRYVMNYLVFLADYCGPVTDIISDWPMAAHTPLPESYFSSPSSIHGIEEDSPESAITVRLAWLILLLLCKLDAKAGLYKEHVALSYLFLANNLNYVVSKVRKSKLRLLMGSEWISKHELKVKQYTSNYERMGWSKVMTSFPDDQTVFIPLHEIRNYFRKFNASFEEAIRIQASWVIPDSKLRDQVKISLARSIIPVYRVFYHKYREVMVPERESEPIVRFAPEDLENYLSDLFFGNGSGGSTATTATTTSYRSSYPSSTTSASSSSRGQQR